jgi:hypothetical protein
MSYESSFDNALRFGDIVSGLVLSAVGVDEPKAEFKKDYHIEVNHPKFAAILSPCCSIGEKTLTLSPLLQVNPKWLTNPYLTEDLTRINRPMRPEQSVSPSELQRMSPEDRQRRFDLSKPESLAFAEYFVYDKHDLLPSYPVVSKTMGINTETGYYMIDFRRIYRLVCKQVTSPTSAPLEIKLLQLSVQTRSELREKLSSYFARIPPEDQI